MTEFKQGDKVWWVRDSIDGVKVLAVAILRECEYYGLYVTVESEGGWNCHVTPRDLYRKHAEAIQAAMEIMSEEISFVQDKGWE